MNKISERTGVFMEWRGHSLLLVEGIDSLLSYRDNEIILGACEQKISVNGAKLEMKYLAKDRIAIEGNIRAVQYV